MSQEMHFAGARPVAAAPFGYASTIKWAGGAVFATLAIIGALVSWRWIDGTLLSVGIEDAGTTTVDEAQLLDRVRTFELVTTRDTYDTRSNTEFHKRVNLGVTKFGLPGFVAGEELDVKAEVMVSAGVDLAGITAQDIEIIDQGDGAVVVVRIPQAQLMGAEIEPSSFDISTGQGVLDRIGSAVGLGGRDVRDGAVEAVTSLAREEAIQGGLLTEASLAAREQLQGFLQALPQTDGKQITYLVEFQSPPAH
jgi:hypothetical protein